MAKIEPDHRSVVLAALARSYEYRETPFKLASGELSHDYIDCRVALSMGAALEAAAHLVGQAMTADVSAIGGPATGSYPLAIAVALLLRHQRGKPCSWFGVRSVPKDHGTGRLIEGDLRGVKDVCLVDDVLTSGGSLIRAAELCEDNKLLVRQVIVLVDREERGGLTRVRKRVQERLLHRVPVTALFTKAEVKAAWASGRSDVTFTAGDLQEDGKILSVRLLEEEPRQ